MLIYKKRRAMNKERRKRLEKVISQLEDLQVEVASIQEEEQEAFDNMTEGLQNSERGQGIQENADNLESVDIDFENLLDALREVLEG